MGRLFLSLSLENGSEKERTWKEKLRRPSLLLTGSLALAGWQATLIA
jgi:hypothetical protein